MAIYLAHYEKKYTGLAYKFKVNPVSCANHSHFEAYLRISAITDYITGKGKTHVIIDEVDNGGMKIVGFVTLRATSLIIAEQSSQIGRPAIEITEIAVDVDYERKGFGRELVNVALAIADELRHNYVGIEYVVACADPIAESFYTHMGFAKLSNYYEVPREGWNIECVPMAFKFSEMTNEYP